MAYQTYITEALVCGSKTSNTSDKSFLLFTRDGGMLYAAARSVREERSKQRYALQDFSLVRVSLVRGKSGWRVGSVENEFNAFLRSGVARPARASLLRIVKLLRQFVHGEEAHPELFDDVRAAVRALAAGTGDAANIGEIFTLRLLHKLGYIATDPLFASFLTEEAWTGHTDELPGAATRAIERALTVSHL